MEKQDRAMENLLQRLERVASVLEAPEGENAAGYLPDDTPSLLRQVRAVLRRSAEASDAEQSVLWAMLENTHAQLAYFDAEFNFMAVNSTYVQHCGYNREELIGRNHFELFPNDENEAIFRRVRDTGDAVVFYARPFAHPKRPGNGLTYWDWSLTPVKGQDNKVRGLVLSLIEVTKQQQAQMQIKELSRFPHENPNPVLRITGEGKILYANRGSEPLLVEWDSRIGDQVPAEWQRYITETLAANEGRTIETLCGTHAFSLNIVPVTEKGYINLYGLDITERKEIEQTIRRYSDQLEILHEVDHAILAANEAKEVARVALSHLARMVRYRVATVELFDAALEEGTVLAIRSESEIGIREGARNPLVWREPIERLKAGSAFIAEDIRIQPQNLFIETLRRQGALSLVSIPLIAEGKLIGCLGIGLPQVGGLTRNEMRLVHDLADQLAIGIQQAHLRAQIERYAEELEKRVRTRTAQLQASDARFRAIFEQTAIGIALLDKEGKVIASNPAVQQMLGHCAQELAGERLLDFAHPEAEIEPHAEKFAALVARERESYRMEIRCRGQNQSLRWMNVVFSAVRDNSGKLQFVVAMVEDTTERKRAQEALVQSEKLSTTGKLAASLAHEINNPLQTVIGCLGLAEESLAEGEDENLSAYVEMALEELRRAARIVKRLRDVSRPADTLAMEPADVNALIDRALTLMRKQLQNEQIELTQRTADDLPKPKVIPDRIQQVLLNLLLNALEAMPQGGTLEIDTRYDDERSEICLAITDSGVGISPDVLPDIFDPFFSTKEGGTGLGLFVSQNMVQECGGRLEVESEEGKGSTFTVRLPVPATNG